MLKDDKAKIDAVIWHTKGAGACASSRRKGSRSSPPGASRPFRENRPIDCHRCAGTRRHRRTDGAAGGAQERSSQSRGSFRRRRKKPRPFLPRVIGIVTSPTGAVIRDMLAGFTSAFRPVWWCGRCACRATPAPPRSRPRSAASMHLRRGPLAASDVLIVARGGGSLEDLWGFNDEIVVRAAAASAIPIISAVGHETDWTLIDLRRRRARAHATKAAEWAVPRYADSWSRPASLGCGLGVAARRAIDGMRAHLRAAVAGCPVAAICWRCRGSASTPSIGGWAGRLLANTRAHAHAHDPCALRLQPRLLAAWLADMRHRLDALGRRADPLWRVAIAPRRARLERVAGRLARSRSSCASRVATSGSRRWPPAHARPCSRACCRPPAPSRRLRQAAGLAQLSWRPAARLCTDARRRGRTLRSTAQIAAGQLIDIELADGRVGAQALTGTAPGTRLSRSRRRAPRRGPRLAAPGGGNQGSLF